MAAIYWGAKSEPTEKWHAKYRDHPALYAKYKDTGAFVVLGGSLGFNTLAVHGRVRDRGPEERGAAVCMRVLHALDRLHPALLPPGLPPELLHRDLSARSSSWSLQQGGGAVRRCEEKRGLHLALLARWRRKEEEEGRFEEEEGGGGRMCQRRRSFRTEEESKPERGGERRRRRRSGERETQRGAPEAVSETARETSGERERERAGTESTEENGRGGGRERGREGAASDGAGMSDEINAERLCQARAVGTIQRCIGHNWKVLCAIQRGIPHTWKARALLNGAFATRIRHRAE
eukprot:2315634-Rhodomonas_salina.1